MELTKLQRLGISSLLLDLRNVNNVIQNGTITFNDETGIMIMIVKDYKGYRYSYTIEKVENIDTTFEYEYGYDIVNNIFRIITIKSGVFDS